MFPLSNPVQPFGRDDATHAQRLLATAKELTAHGRDSSIRQAVTLVSQAIEVWQQFHEAGTPGAQRQLAAAWLIKANALREMQDAASRPQALHAYDEALRHFQAVMQSDDPTDVNELANIWINRGMTLLDDGSGPALSEALPCFDRAIELRRGLPLDQAPLFRWGLSAAWMNRADVLARLGAPAQLAEALRSYDEAIGLLEAMPLDEHPTYRARLALAWMNRGLTAQAQSDSEAFAEALRCYALSIQQLQGNRASLTPEQRRILSCAHLNRGDALLNTQLADPFQAREDALTAMKLVAEFEQAEVLAARMGLKSRHLLCQAIVHLVDRNELPEDWLGETTDAVDDGMALARRWRRKGGEGLDELESELFRFGALIYRVCQPHFLAEYLLDSMDPIRSPGAPAALEKMHHLATEARWNAVMEIRARQQADASANTQAKLLLRLEELQTVETRLEDLRGQHLIRAAPAGGAS